MSATSSDEDGSRSSLSDIASEHALADGEEPRKPSPSVFTLDLSTGITTSTHSPTPFPDIHNDTPAGRTPRGQKRSAEWPVRHVSSASSDALGALSNVTPKSGTPFDFKRMRRSKPFLSDDSKKPRTSGSVDRFIPNPAVTNSIAAHSLLSETSRMGARVSPSSKPGILDSSRRPVPFSSGGHSELSPRHVKIGTVTPGAPSVKKAKAYQKKVAAVLGLDTNEEILDFKPTKQRKFSVGGMQNSFSEEVDKALHISDDEEHLRLIPDKAERVLE